MNLQNIHTQKAFDWLQKESGENFLSSQEHCQTRDVFEARIRKMSQEMERSGLSEEIYAPLVAVAGEIGNNSFDHNIGNWHDVPGVYFVHNLEDKFIVIADRGRGLLATLRGVAPYLQNENEAIKIAFTEKISGRAPEKRGNGLKFVASVARRYDLKIHFYSNDGMYIINNGMQQGDNSPKLKGVLAVINF